MDIALDEGLAKGDSVASLLDSALDAGGGLLRLTPTWVPRSFLHPGRRIKLHPNDYYRFGADRGGTEDEVFISHEAATAGVKIENTGAEPLVGLRYFGPEVHGDKIPKAGS